MNKAFDTEENANGNESKDQLILGISALQISEDEIAVLKSTHKEYCYCQWYHIFECSLKS